MYQQKKPRNDSLTLFRQHQRVTDSQLQKVEAEIRQCQQEIDLLCRPLRRHRTSMASYHQALASQKNHFRRDQQTAQMTVAELLQQEKKVEAACKQAVKQSGLLDRFSDLNTKRLELLEQQEETQFTYLTQRRRF